MKRNTLFLSLLAAMALSAGCKKSVEGFLSDTIFYRANPFRAPIGQVAYSAPLEVDGSTSPLSVKLLAIRDKATGKIADNMLAEQDVTTFTGEVTWQDSTLALLQKKITTSKKKPFYVNPVGGRLELTPATTGVGAGNYTIDLEVSNVRGTRVLHDVCEIQLQSSGAPYELQYQAWSASDDNGVFTTPPGAYSVSVDRVPSGPNKIILKFVDRNGSIFNPKGGEVINRGDRPTLKNWDPYFPEEATDTALVYPYPNVPQFPIFQETMMGSAKWTGFICYYRIPARFTDINRHLNPVFTIKYNLPGTYIVTARMGDVVKKS
ncbi:hypothetical protein V9K67_17740 [Paraflavisolibacter sp. H34]|uniref:hypothetical protein n=1 Tax=Huijunlia imazamoxiresistens TaxID=3127457 RepID=UPI00301ADC97